MDTHNPTRRDHETTLRFETWETGDFSVPIQEAAIGSEPGSTRSRLGTASPKQTNSRRSAAGYQKETMKQLHDIISKAVAVIALAVLLTGCNKSFFDKSYKAVLADNEDTPTAVVIDGRTDGGKVRRVYVDGSGRRIAEFTVSRDSEGLIREGVIRVPGGNAIQLRTDLASGQPLASGTYIRAETTLGVAAKKWGAKALAITAVAAVAAVICLRRFLAFRAAAPFIPILLAIGLALITAYSAHGLAVPIASDLMQKIQVKAGATHEAKATDNSSGTEHNIGWAGKARAVERDFVGFLRTPTDAPRMLSFVAIFAITLPVFAGLIAWLFRKLAYQPVVCGFLLLAVGPTILNAAPAQAGVSYTREFLRDEQRSCQQLLFEVERNLATAARLLDSKLSGAPELVVRGLFLTDLLGIRLEGHSDRIVQLKSGFGYVRSDEQRKFNATYAELRQRLQLAQVDAAKLSDRCNATTNTATVLRVFQTKQADYRNLIRAGLADVNIVLEECNRQSKEAMQTPATTEPQPDAETAAELARLQREQAELQVQLATMRRVHEEAAAHRPVAPQVVVITNEVRIEKVVPAPAPPPEVRYITNTVIAVETNKVDASTTAPFADHQSVPTDTAPGPRPSGEPSLARNQESGVLETVWPTETVEVDPLPVVATSAVSGTKTRKPILNVSSNALYVAGGVILIAFIWFVSRAISGRVRVLQIARDGKPLEAFTISNADDVLVLSAEPRLEHRSQVGDRAAIRPTWRGAILDPGSDSVTVNAEPVQKSKRLTPGDRLTASIGDRELHTFDFLGCDQINEAVEA